MDGKSSGKQTSSFVQALNKTEIQFMENCRWDKSCYTLRLRQLLRTSVKERVYRVKTNNGDFEQFEQIFIEQLCVKDIDDN